MRSNCRRGKIFGFFLVFLLPLSIGFPLSSGPADPELDVLDRYLQLRDGYWTGVLSTSDRWGGVESTELQMYQKNGDRLLRLLKKGKGTIYYILIKKGGSEVYLRDVLLERKYERDASLLDLEIPESTFPLSYLTGGSLSSWMLSVSAEDKGKGRLFRLRPLLDGRLSHLDVFFQKDAEGSLKPLRLDYFRQERILYRTIDLRYDGVVISRKTASPVEMDTIPVAESMELESGRVSRLEWISYDEQILPPDLFFNPTNLGRK